MEQLLVMGERQVNKERNVRLGRPESIRLASKPEQAAARLRARHGSLQHRSHAKSGDLPCGDGDLAPIAHGAYASSASLTRVEGAKAWKRHLVSGSKRGLHSGETGTQHLAHHSL